MSAKIAKNLERFAQAVAAHDRLNARLEAVRKNALSIADRAAEMLGPVREIAA